MFELHIRSPCLDDIVLNLPVVDDKSSDVIKLAMRVDMVATLVIVAVEQVISLKLVDFVNVFNPVQMLLFDNKSRLSDKL